MIFSKGVIIPGMRNMLNDSSDPVPFLSAPVRLDKCKGDVQRGSDL